MFSSLASNNLPSQYFNNRRSLKSDVANNRNGHSVHLFKGPTITSNYYAATAKFEGGYEPLPSLGLRQPRSTSYSSEPDPSNKIAGSRDVSKSSSFLASTSNANYHMYERHAPSSNYGMHSSMSDEPHLYERSLSDIYASSDSSAGDSDGVPESPSSVTTNISTVLAPDTTSFQSLPRTLATSTSSAVPVQETTPHRIPTLPQMDTITGLSVSTSDTRQSSLRFNSAPPNKVRSRRLSTQMDLETAGTVTAACGDPSASRERPGHQRLDSLGTRSRDSRVLYPPATGYLYTDDGNSERQSATVALPGRSGTEMPKPSVYQYTPNDLVGGHSMPSSHYTQFESRDVLLPYPPGLDRYPPENLHSVSTSHANSVPRRRHSDGDQVPMNSTRPTVVEDVRSSSTPPLRSVRWNENLICPSPILSSQRRKGWFNRRGDQLWTNDGAFKPPPKSQEYPADLDDYPEYNVGWQNEEGVRIDMQHRFIPKQPLRSALKQPPSRERTDGHTVRGFSPVTR